MKSLCLGNPSATAPGLLLGAFFCLVARLHIGMEKGVLSLVSQATFTGVTVAEVRTHLNITDTSTDAYIQTLIDAARVYAERYTMMDFTSSVWILTLEQFPARAAYNWYDRYGNYVYGWPLTNEFPIGRATQRWQRIDLKRGPVTAVNSITYFDSANTQQTVSSSDYAVIAPSFAPGAVEPVTYWPAAYPRPGAASINFSTGFTSNLPAQVKHAIRLLVGVWWSSREDLMYGPGTVGNAVGNAVDALLGQLRAGAYS